MSDAIKQNVQWFPGHMAKTRRIIKESLKKVDGAVVILDARIPESSRNPEIDSIIDGKPAIYILNKSDLADPEITKKWLEFYRSSGVTAIAVDCTDSKWAASFRKLVSQVLEKKIKNNEEKGMAGKKIRLMILGIPNTGKSTFINRLSGNSKAKAEDRAGVTKQSSWYVCGGNIEVLDTPGVLWPKFDDEKVGDKLAFTGGIKDNVFDVETLAVRFLEIIKKYYPERLAERYKFKDKDEFERLEPFEILEEIARKRGFLMRGGLVDTEKAANVLFDEYRAGKLGKITLESPEDFI